MGGDLRPGEPVIAAGFARQQAVDAGRGLRCFQAQRRQIRLATRRESRDLAGLAPFPVDHLDPVTGEEMQDDGAIAEHPVMLDAGIEMRQSRFTDAKARCGCAGQHLIPWQLVDGSQAAPDARCNGGR